MIVGHSLTSNSCVHGGGARCSAPGPGSAWTSIAFRRVRQLPRIPLRHILPVTPDPSKPDGRWYAADFPNPCTIRDNVRLQRMLWTPRRPQPAPAVGEAHGVHARARVRRLLPRYVRELVLVAGCGRHGLGHRHRRGGTFRYHGGREVGGRGLRPERSPKAGLAAARMTAMPRIARLGLWTTVTTRDDRVGHRSTGVETDAAR